MKKHKFTVVLACSFAILVALGSAPLVWAEPIYMDPAVMEGTIVLEDGTSVDFQKEVGTLSNTCDYDWWYGCSPTSAGMMLGYYDRNGYGSTDYSNLVPGGVAESETYGGSPGWAALANNAIASQGHVADFWGAPDPLGSGRTIPAQFDCLADFMGTSQDSNGNPDGGTSFWNYTNGNKLNYHQIPGISQIPDDDSGMYGIHEYMEYAGYGDGSLPNPHIVNLYNQYINPYSAAGFTLAQYTAEIDAGRPVLIHVSDPGVGGHTMLAVGYNDTNTSQIEVYDTWTPGPHTMTWGGWYGGMLHKSVTVLEPVPEPSTFVLLCVALAIGLVGYVRRRRR